MTSSVSGLFGLRLLPIFGIGVAFLSGCSESASSGQFVTIPSVSVACTTARCKGNTTGTAYLTYTTSGCTNPSFGETATGSVTVTCNGATGCTGNITSFSNTAGTATSIREGYYSACITVDFNSNYAGSAVAGDSSGASNITQIVSGSGVVTVNSFTDL